VTVMEPLRNIFLSWDEAFQAGACQAGGKGWNLSRLVRFGLRIPVGGVLSTEAYLQFIGHNQLEAAVESVIRTVKIENMGECNDILRQVREKIRAGSLPPRVMEELAGGLEGLGIAGKAIAIRSSASAEDSAQASFAGVHESYLNVTGWENILNAVKDCYASLWTPQAVAYRRKLNIADHEVIPAVVLMEMVEAQAAGIGFTCDPQTGRPDIFIVNANFGLGESVVSGTVEPDNYYLDTQAYNAVPRLISKKIGAKQEITQACENGGTHSVPSENMASQQVLSDKDIERLGLILMRVFEALGDCEQHQDVEWAFDGQDFVLLQARPVTALPRYTFDALKNKPDIWSNGNFRDAVPMVLSPLHRRLMKNIIDTMQYTSFSAPGFPIPEGFQFSRFFKGRLYCNISALQWAYYDSSGMLPSKEFNDFWGGHQPEIEIEDPEPYKGEIGLERQHRAMKGMALTAEAAKSAPATFAEVADSVRAVCEKGFSHLHDRDFVNKYNELGNIIGAYSEKFIFLSGIGSFAMMSLFQTLGKHLGPRTPIVINGLMVGGETGITSADHGYRLIELADLARQDEAAIQYLNGDNYNPLSWDAQLPESSTFKRAFRKFIEEYGHRAVYELDIMNPRWKEDPSYLLDIIKSTMDIANPSKFKAQQKDKFDLAWQEICEKVPSEEQAAIRQNIKEAQEGAAVREMNKSVLVIALEPYRLMALELGKRLSQRGIIAEQSDIFFCSWSELVSILQGDWNGDRLLSLVESRRIDQREKEALAPPDVILGEESIFSEPMVQASDNCLIGVGAASGKASGIARIINHPREGNMLQPGDVLIAPSTDPGWTPLFLKACAVVMETGGFLSHGAIVAREYGVPAVVNVPGAMRAVRDGQTVMVDGDAGKVFLY